jgi:hypothetical protein
MDSKWQIGAISFCLGNASSFPQTESEDRDQIINIQTMRTFKGHMQSSKTRLFKKKKLEF